MQPTTQLHFDEQGNMAVKRTQDVDPIMEQVKREREDGNGKTEYGYHVAELPAVILEQWGIEDFGRADTYFKNFNDNPEVARKFAIRLNSRDFCNFRVWGGKVGLSDLVR